MGTHQETSRLKNLLQNPYSSKKSKCVTRTLPLWSVTMAPACARLALLETTPPGPFSHPSLDVPATRVSWLAWDRRTPTSVTRPSPRGYPHPEVPRRARNHHQLGRHGEDLAPHL